MTKPFRLGIIGTGQITAQSHLPAALASREVEVAALVDPVVARANKLCREFGIRPKVAGDVADVLGDVDGVIIATPNHTHKALAVQCAGKAVHCLIEKPLSNTVEEGEEILQVAAQRGVTIALGYSHRPRNEVVLFKDLLDSGYFGAPKRFMYQAGSRGGWAPMSAYNLDRKTAGGGVLVVTGTHFLDMMLYWFGYPDDVEYEDDSHGGPEAHCEATVHYTANGRNFRGHVRLSKTVGIEAGFAMEAEHGLVVYPTKPGAQLLFRPSGQPGAEIVLRPRGKNLFPTDRDEFTIQLEQFVRACRGQGKPIVDGQQGLESVKLVRDFYQCRTALREDWAESVQKELVA